MNSQRPERAMRIRQQQRVLPCSNAITANPFRAWSL